MNENMITQQFVILSRVGSHSGTHLEEKPSWVQIIFSLSAMGRVLIYCHWSRVCVSIHVIPVWIQVDQESPSAF